MSWDVESDVASVSGVLPQDRPQRPGASSAKAPPSFISLADALCSDKDVKGACTKAKVAPTSNRARGRKGDLSKFHTNTEADVTTVMIRGIPCGLTKNCMMEILDAADLEGKYDFFYLPMAGQAKGNLGYAFVNFVHPSYAALCSAVMHNVSLDPVRSTKVCTISPADIQGMSSLRKHFRKTAVSHSRHGPVFPKVDYPTAAPRFA